MREHLSYARWAIAAVALTVGACGGTNENHPVAKGGSGGSAGTSGAAGTNGGGAGTSSTAGTSGNAGNTGSSGAGSTGSGSAGSAAAGASGTAGASGGAGASAGASGTAGSASGGGGMSGLPNAVASTGCGMQPPPTQTLATYVKYSEMVPASTITKGNWLLPRTYWVWLPSNYNPSHAYPTVFVGPGCGGSGDSAIQMQKASGNDAIVVGLDYNKTATGRDCFMTESFPDPETEYVENTVKMVEDAFCVDKSRLFIEGFSSGSWISYLMGCVDGGPGGLFKGQGNASGEMQGSCPESACKGPTPYMAGHNNPDGNNNYPGGRDHMLKMNKCTMPPQTMPYDPGPMVKPPKAGVTIDCVQYMGCMAPTIFCTTTGLGHDPQESTGISTFGFWKFWMSLP
jgi:hypothetical protein